MFKAKGLRWLIFLIAFGIDLVIFLISDPFSAWSFFTSGVAALLMYAGIAKLSAIFVRGKGRIRNALTTGEKVLYITGRHWIHLLREIRGISTSIDKGKDDIAAKDQQGTSRWILVPFFVASMTSLYFFLWVLYLLDKALGW